MGLSLIQCQCCSVLLKSEHVTVMPVTETFLSWLVFIIISSKLIFSSPVKQYRNSVKTKFSHSSFLSLGKELSWNISRLEDSLMAATDRLPPDQACQSHTRLHNILTVAQPPEPPPEMQWSPVSTLQRDYRNTLHFTL